MAERAIHPGILELQKQLAGRDLTPPPPRPVTVGMGHSPEWQHGRRNGIKWAIAWLHSRAIEMNDSRARAILNTAAFNMGHEAKYRSDE